MKKEYIKPEVELISLIVKDAITDESNSDIIPDASMGDEVSVF